MTPVRYQWKTASGEIKDIRKMDTDHLHYCVGTIHKALATRHSDENRRKLVIKSRRILSELHRRGQA